MDDFIPKIIKDNKKVLDNKNEQTNYKIKYITNYVKNWLIVLSNTKFCTNLNFIDCMSNAGIYLDGEYSTAMNVLELFVNFAKKFPNKNYSLYINDISKEKLKVFEEIANLRFRNGFPKNIKIYKNNSDVNDYIKILTSNDNLFNFPNSTILYVDPYDFGTVHIPTLKSFAEKYYCEIIFNVFTSDFVRNRMDARIVKMIDNPNVNINTKEELVDYIISQLKVNKMKYSFQYEFRIQTNVELYQIMFLTPSDKGLDELKNSLWDTFKGFAFHRNHKKTTTEQISFFSEEDDVNEHLKRYSLEAREIIKLKYKNQALTYQQICNEILPNSMLKSTHIIQYVLKPGIEAGEFIKRNKYGKLNYKKDIYKIN